MEMTYEESEKALNESFDEYPKIKALIASPTFEKTLGELLVFFEINPDLLGIIKDEVLVMLGFSVPMSELAQNIAESTGIELEVAERLTTMIKAVLLKDVYDDLYAFDLAWKADIAQSGTLPEVSKEMREKLELRPEGVTTWNNLSNENTGASGPKPLTREEVLQSLAPKRTMASDIASIKDEENTTPGY